MNAEQRGRLIEPAQHRQRHAEEAANVHPGGLGLRHLHGGVRQAEVGVFLVGASRAHKGAEEIRLLSPVVLLLPRGQQVVLLGAEGRDGRHDGLVVLDGQDDDWVTSGLLRQIVARDEVVIVFFAEGLRRTEE